VSSFVDPKRKTTANDVALAKALGRYELGKRAVYVLYILAAGVVVWLCKYPADALAGKDTSVTLKFTVTIGITVALGGTVATLVAKNRKQSKELVRLRKRQTELESDLDDCMKKKGVS
jgi:hypothetical protein